MKEQDWKDLYEAMKDLFNKDKELTNIVIDFSIKPVVTEKKIARIDIKTFKDGYRLN